MSRRRRKSRGPSVLEQVDTPPVDKGGQTEADWRRTWGLEP